MRGLYYDDGQARFYLGDVREVLRQLDPESVNMCVTSPPYWSLRDYGIEPSVWEPQVSCWEQEHEWQQEDRAAQHSDDGITGSTLQGGKATQSIAQRTPTRSSICRVCGAWLGALGLEPTPEMYVDHIVEVFREVKRVLRKDGTLWLNLGDSYNAYNGNRGTESQYAGKRNIMEPSFPTGHGLMAASLKPKDLVGIPWMVAFALRADGWWLRQDIIWAKPNPMPESVTDRCTKAHEDLFLLSKSERYYYDADAIREPATDTGRENGRDGRPEYGDPRRLPPGARPQTLARQDFTDRGRNKRSVWTIPTSPFPEAHFATFPPALVEPCILAGCPEGGVVLDPFLGSGTTALVAKRMGRRVVGIDLKAEYLDMAVRRCAQMGLVAVPSRNGEH